MENEMFIIFWRSGKWKANNNIIFSEIKEEGKYGFDKINKNHRNTKSQGHMNGHKNHNIEVWGKQIW
jgi:hypothetical protein